MKKRRAERGFTLLEFMLVGGMMVIVFFLIALSISPITQFFQRSRNRQQADLQARICMESIQHLLSIGRASTLSLTTIPPSAQMPSDFVSFYGVDGAFHSIQWTNSPNNTVIAHSQSVATGIGPIVIRTLGTNVTSLLFSLPDYTDPTLVNVTLQMVFPMDSSGSSSSYYTILLNNQAVRMVSY